MGVFTGRKLFEQAIPILKAGRPRLCQVKLDWQVGRYTPAKSVRLCGAYEVALKNIFGKSAVEAINLINECRQENTAVVAELAWEIAETKANDANDFVGKRLPYGFRPAMVFNKK